MAIPVPVAYLQMKTGYVIMKKSPEVLKMTKLYLANTEPLADPDLFERFYRTVPCHRKEKIDTIKFPKGKRQCLGAWILLAYALKEAGIHQRDICLIYGPDGKPYLADFPDVHFNLSHSGRYVFCAVSNEEVGCDVQKIAAADLRVTHRFFAPEECEKIATAPEAVKNELFFRYWTLKESFIKNIGRGLSLPLQSFCIHLDGDRPSVSQSVLPEEHFYFREFDLQDGYRYACCARKPEIEDIQLIQIVDCVYA